MKKHIIIIVFASLLAPLCHVDFGSATAQKVTFYSPEFEEGVRLHLELEDNEDVVQSQTDTITTLCLAGMGITDIRDAVYLPALKHLDLGYNEVDDVSPLLPLASLRTLNLKGNRLEDISILAFAAADSLTVDVSNNSIADFTYFFSPTHCLFSFIGMGEQAERNPAYFTVSHLYADMVDGKPVVCYRGYTNMAEASYVVCASTRKAAVMDGSYQTVELPDELSETTMASVTNGEQGATTYVVPPADYSAGAGQTVTLETGLPDDYRLSSAYAEAGTVEIVGNTMQYTAPQKAVSDVVHFCYHLGCTLKGFSMFYVNKGRKGDVNGDGSVDVGDIMAVINIMASSPQPPEGGMNGDINGDGQVDVGDIMAIINIMASSPPASCRVGD